MCKSKKLKVFSKFCSKDTETLSLNTTGDVYNVKQFLLLAMNYDINVVVTTKLYSEKKSYVLLFLVQHVDIVITVY